MISMAEWQVMRTVWTNQKVSATQVHLFLGQEFEWSLSTVKTLLGRLVKKGYLTSTKQQREFIYTAAANEMDVLLQKQQELLSLICTTQQGDFLQHVVMETPLSKADAQKMMDGLLQRLPTLPEKVGCHCLKGQCHCHH